jgi:hypothetical protein
MTDDSTVLKQRYDEIALTLDDKTTACDFSTFATSRSSSHSSGSAMATGSWTSAAG